MSSGPIQFERGEDGIALLTVARPEKLNALDGATMADLSAAIARCETEPEVRGLIVTGAGEKAFVAGADIQELAAMTPLGAQALAHRGQAIFRRLETMLKPSVAAVNGFALGGGLELALACTVRVASPNAKLGQPEVKLGIIPGYGGTQRLPRLVGRGRALEMLLTGDPIDAAEAYRIGLVNHVVPQAELIAFSRDLLRKMLRNGSAALALAMQAVVLDSTARSTTVCASRQPPSPWPPLLKIVSKVRARSLKSVRPCFEESDPALTRSAGAELCLIHHVE